MCIIKAYTIIVAYNEEEKKQTIYSSIVNYLQTINRLQKFLIVTGLFGAYRNKEIMDTDSDTETSAAEINSTETASDSVEVAEDVFIAWGR